MTSSVNTNTRCNGSLSGRALSMTLVMSNSIAIPSLALQHRALLFFYKQPICTIITMPKMFIDRYRSDGVSIAGGMLSGPVAESRPASALPELAISSYVAAP